MSSNRRIEEQVEGETVDVAAAGVGDSDEAGAAGEAVVGAAGGGDDDKKNGIISAAAETETETKVSWWNFDKYVARL